MFARDVFYVSEIVFWVRNVGIVTKLMGLSCFFFTTSDFALEHERSIAAVDPEVYVSCLLPATKLLC